MKRLLQSIILIFSISLFISGELFSQAGTGKLAGKIIDSETNEPLIGANVVLVNSELGAATNAEGDFYVLNINPGTYTVRISYVGYSPKLVKDVRIVAGITYQLNIELSAGLVAEEVVVTDKRFFEEKATNTVKVIDADDISRLPVKGIESVASLEAGVVMERGNEGASGNAVINVRGGRGGEVLYIIDGIPQNDIYSGMNYSQVSNSAIEQISFQVGGYEAKYGQAQSGIVNVTTKSGTPEYTLFADVLTSQFTDPYGYNLYTGNISGPFLPGNNQHKFFLSAERGWFLDGAPRAIDVDIPSSGFHSDFLPNNSSSVWRYTAKTTHNFGPFSLWLSANINDRMFHDYVHDYVKNNPQHNPKYVQTNYSYSSKFSHNLSSSSFWNITLGYKLFKEERGDGFWFENIEAYGDSAENAKYGVKLPNGNGTRVSYDDFGIFSGKGRVNDAYNKVHNSTLTADLDFTTQINKHLLEIGGGINYNILRYYFISPVGLALSKSQNISVEEKYKKMQPTVFGFDITGKNKTSKGSEFAPKTPMLLYGYIQDRYEIEDMVINLGLRLDYFDSQSDVIKDPGLPFGGGSDPNAYDKDDYVTKKPEFYISPRIGLGFPVTSTTVFHTQYGKFIQQPSLDQFYSTTYGLNNLIQNDNLSVNTGHIASEVTTQYEIGFRQVIADVAALNITAFYKNTKGLINTTTVFFHRELNGAQLRYITPANTDFGTVKGLALSLDIPRFNYFSLSFDYTYSYAEGTGSSTSSSYVATFRNINGEIPKVIAPLDFDQRHTGIINLNFNVPQGELGFMEMFNANVLVRFASGRPYTPLESQNLLEGYTNYGDTKGYVNSAYGPGNFSVDLKLERSFIVGKTILTPYIWIENLFDADNEIQVYQSTGSAYSTGWLSTEEGQKYSKEYKTDYSAFERNPENFGIPRLIKVGVKVNLSNIQL